jgi:hypothetical protein
MPRATLSLLPLVLALAFAAAIRFELARLAPPFLVANDSADYFSAAYTWLSSGELHLSLKRTPLYPAYLAGLIQLVGPSLDRLLVAQHALGLLTVALTYLLGRLAFGPLAAGVAAMAMALNGSMLTMEHLLISENLFTPLLLAALAAFCLALRTQRSGVWLLAGVLLGLCTLSRPLGFAVVLALLVILPFSITPTRSTLLRATVLLLLGAAICIAPWMVRQAMVHERAVVNGGLGDAMFSRVRRYEPTFTLRDDGRPVSEADRAIRARIFELAPQYEYPREIRAVLREEFGATDVAADQILQDVAITVIAQDPMRYLAGTLQMTGRLLRGSDPGLVDLWASIGRDRVLQGWPAGLQWALTTDRPLDDPHAFDRARWILEFYRDDLKRGVVVLSLAPVGGCWALMARRRTGAAAIPLVVLTQIVLYVALDGPLFRYRYPYQPLIILLGAAGCAVIVQTVVSHWRDIWATAGARRQADLTGSSVATMRSATTES